LAYSPLYVGETHKPLTVTWSDDSGNALNLTGATLSVRFVPNSGSAFAGTGTFSVTNAAAGQFTYTFSTSDVATAATYILQFKANYAAGNDQFSDPITIQILPTY
jgi:hypothetical protein